MKPSQDGRTPVGFPHLPRTFRYYRFAPHSYSLLAIAWTAAERSRVDQQQALVAVIMAASAAESFINELPQFITSNPEEPGVKDRDVEERFLAVADVLFQLEKVHADVTVKYIEASKILGRPFDSTSPPFRDFATVIAMRSDLVRPRLDDDWAPDPNDPKLEMLQWPHYMADLGFARPIRFFMNWRFAIGQPTAVLACESVEKVVQTIMGEFPTGGRVGRLVSPLYEQWVVDGR